MARGTGAGPCDGCYRDVAIVGVHHGGDEGCDPKCLYANTDRDNQGHQDHRVDRHVAKSHHVVESRARWDTAAAHSYPCAVGAERDTVVGHRAVGHPGVRVRHIRLRFPWDCHAFAC